MATIGYHASHEQHTPSALLRDVARGGVSVVLEPYGYRWFRVVREGRRTTP